MDFDNLLHHILYYGFAVVGIPVAVGVAYFSLLLHQSVRNEERYGELKKREGRRHERLRRLEEAKRLADPYFHFNIGKAKDIDELVAEKLAVERGTKRLPSKQEMKILKAIDEGRLILLDTSIDDCAPGMVVGRSLDRGGLLPGDELTTVSLSQLRAAGVASLPILYNPNRVVGALAGRGV